MGKRRKRDWYIYNKNQPQRRSGTGRRNFPHDRKAVFRYLVDELWGQNAGKCLSRMHARGEYYYVERDRQRDQASYIVRARGGYLTATRIKYLVDGEGQNAFLLGLLGSQDKPVTIQVDQLVKVPYRQWERFIEEYKAATPELEWWDDLEFS